MLRPYQLFTAFGISVRAHGRLLVFLVLLGAMVGITGDFDVRAALVFLIFAIGSLVLHEIGHCIVALYHRVPVRSITLYPLGGAIRLGRTPGSFLQGLPIVLAGPLVNIVLTVAFGLLYVAVPDPLISALASVNVGLGLFNLIPGFPMDGGRLLQFGLTGRLGYFGAARVSAQVGRSVAVVVGVTGLFFHFGLLFLAYFLYTAARAELQVLEEEEEEEGACSAIFAADDTPIAPPSGATELANVHFLDPGADLGEESYDVGLAPRTIDVLPDRSTGAPTEPLQPGAPVWTRAIPATDRSVREC